MPAILYGTGAYRRDNGNLPELKLKNMFLESAMTSAGGVSLQSRQGLTTKYTVGNGPVTGLFCQDNVFDGSVFCLSGGMLYRDETLLGPVVGTGPVSFAAGSYNELALTAGGAVYRYDGSGLAPVPFPDGADVAAITFHDGLYIAIRSGGDKWYWSGVLNSGSWNGLDFASAESKPDRLIDIKVINDFLFLIGAETIERWANTGDPDLPYSRVEAAIIQRGARATGLTVQFAGDLVFVADDGIVYKLSEGLERLSDNGIEERLAASMTAVAFGFYHYGHPFYCLRLDNNTFLHDLSTGQWCEFTTHGHNNWKAATACASGLVTLFGDDTSGNVLSFSGHTDAGLPIEKLLTAFFPIQASVARRTPVSIVPVDNLTLVVNVGWTTYVADEGSNPVVEMRSSINAGATWNNWRTASLGAQGHYRTRTRWTRCGTFDFPGAMFEIRCTDPVPFRVSNVLVNEPGGGRSRGV